MYDFYDVTSGMSL